METVKKLCTIALFIFALGCNNNTDPVSGQEQLDSTNSDTITVKGPMTISSNNLYPYTQKNELLNLQLTKGSYHEDWSPSPFAGRNWSGDFQLVITDEHGNIKEEFQLNEHFEEPLVFNDIFEIQFDDYNDDGDIDFTIGQYGTSNGNFYKLFTIKDEHIQELQVKENPELFISNGTSRHSTKLDKVNDKSFTKTMYDNSIGKDMKDTFVWTGNEFRLVLEKDQNE